MTDTVRGLWAAAAATPRDDTVKLALADALLEADDGDPDPDAVHDRDVAHVVASVLVRQRRWPKKDYAGDWHWASGSTAAVARSLTNVLPAPFYAEAKKTAALDRLVDYNGVRLRVRDDYSCRGRVLLLTATLVRLRNQMGARW